MYLVDKTDCGLIKQDTSDCRVLSYLTWDPANEHVCVHVTLDQLIRVSYKLI